MIYWETYFNICLRELGIYHSFWAINTTLLFFFCWENHLYCLYLIFIYCLFFREPLVLFVFDIYLKWVNCLLLIFLYKCFLLKLNWRVHVETDPNKIYNWAWQRKKLLSKRSIIHTKLNSVKNTYNIYFFWKSQQEHSQQI